MTSVYLKQHSPYASTSVTMAPWYLRVCYDDPVAQQLTKDQIFVRNIVERASSITKRDTMYDYLKGQRFYPMRDLQVCDPMLHRFIETELNAEQVCRIGLDQFAHYVASLPFKYVQAIVRERVSSQGRDQKLVNYTLAAMPVFPLRTAFKSYAMMGLYFFQEFDPALRTAFESTDPVPMASAFSSLAKGYLKKSRFELLAAAMMIASADGYLDAARRVKKDEMIQRSHVRDALCSFGLATLFSFSVRENAHCYSPVIVNALQHYAAYMQGSIAGWQILNEER